MIRQEVVNLIEKSIKEFQKEKVFLDFIVPKIKVEKPEEEKHGDYSTNIAMILNKKMNKNPIEIAEILKNQILSFNSNIFEKIEIVAPGFINFFISKEYLQNQVTEILKQKDKFGELKIGKNQKVNVEFISANPTGPLTLGNGRGGFCGDVLVNILKKAGYKVTKEYYINDVGEQVRKLGHSIIGDAEAVYKGKYIEDLRNKIEEKDPEKAGEKGAGIILKEMIKPAVKKMKIEFDVWFSEKDLYKKKEIDKILDFLKKKNLTYEKDGALWFKSTNFGDDKDRVLIKEDGEKTYFVSDIAYLKNKFQRGFEKLIFFWGADHYGYIERIKAAAEALGYKKENIHIIIMQLVAVRLGEKENRELLRMSKRGGIYMGLDKLIEELSLDIVRFFFLNRAPESHLIFDLELAREQSEKNPIYYIQYAYARICSILRRVKDIKLKTVNYKLLKEQIELQLIKELIELPEIVESIAKDYQVQRLPKYVIDLATAFHQFYRNCRVISEDKNLTEARLSLISATKIVLKNTLNLMGISAPEKM